MTAAIVLGYEISDTGLLDKIRTLNRKIKVFFNGQDLYEPIFGMVLESVDTPENFANITLDKLISSMDRHSPMLKKFKERYVIPTKNPDPKLYIVDALPGQG